MRPLFVLLIVTLGSIGAVAQSSDGGTLDKDLSGLTLLAHCKKPVGSADYIWCLRFIAGQAEYMRMIGGIEGGYRDVAIEWGLCGGYVSNEGRVQAFVEWGEKNRDRLRSPPQMNSLWAVKYAMQDKWPCRYR